MATAVCSKIGNSYRFSNSVRSFVCSYYGRKDVSVRSIHHTQVSIYDLTNYRIKSEFKWNCFMSSQLTDFGSQLIAVKTENKLLVNAFTSLTKFLHRNTQS